VSLFGPILFRLAPIIPWILAAEAVAGVPLERSLSSSRQFIVFGGNPRLRGAIADLAEQSKSNVLALLQTDDNWLIPILLNIGQPQANLPEIPPAALNFSQTGAGLKIQLDLLITSEVDAPMVERELLRAILLEIAYRGSPSLPAGIPYVQPPNWLINGILALRDESPAALGALENLGAHPIPLKDFLEQRPDLLDSQSSRLYRAYAGVLVRILTQHGGGRAQLQHYISDLPHASSDPLADLQVHFPWLGNQEKETEQIWSALVAPLANEQRFLLATFSSTSQQLDTLLRTKIAKDHSGRNALTLGEAVRVTHPQVDIPAAREVAQRLMFLAARAHPLLRSVVVDYQLMTQSLAKKKWRGLPKRGAATVELRERVCSRMREAEDFMNWFEATQASTLSGDFRDYVRAARATEKVTRRHDAISVYLDAMELQFQ
jgi:hypothetical protein